MTDLAQAFTHWEAQREFEQAMASDIWARRFEEANRAIAEALERYPSHFTDLCRSVASVEIQGWSELQADFVEQEDRLRDGKGGEIAALSLNIINRLSVPQIYLEAQFYHLSPTADREAAVKSLQTADYIQFNADHWSTIWAYHDRFRITGLEDVSAAQRASLHTGSGSFYGDRAPNDYVGAIAANWFILLRIHEALARCLSSEGLPRPIPVVCRVDHVPWPMEVGEVDYGPSVQGVYMASLWPHDVESVRGTLEARAARRKAERDAETDQIIAELVERRSALRRWWPWVNPQERKKAVEMITAWEGHLFTHIGRSIEKASWELGGRDFAALVRRVRNWRGRGAEDPPMKPVPPDARSELHELFVRHALMFGGRWVRMNLLYDRELLRDGEHPVQTGKRIL
jgi:hypothetical protein